MPAKSRTPEPAKSSSVASAATEVAPGLFVGGWKDADQFSGTRFCVLDEKPDELVGATHIPIYDERTGRALRPNLERLARSIGKARAQGTDVLVFCGHGIRRSPLGAAWYLHRSEGIPLEQAFARIRAVRPRVEPPSAWIEDGSSLEET